MHIRVFLEIWGSPTPPPLLPAPEHTGRSTDGGHDHIAEHGERDRPGAVRTKAASPETESVGGRRRGRPREEFSTALLTPVVLLGLTGPGELRSRRR